MGVVTVTNESFKKEVLTADTTVLVDFYADWCGPCKKLGPVVEDISGMFDGKAKVCKLNIDQAQDIAMQYGVMSIPTLIVFKGGEKKDQLVGAVPKDEIVGLINKHI